MEITLKEYIQKYTPNVIVKIDILKGKADEEFLNSDIFPCDEIAIVDGERVKVLLFANGDRRISVIDLLSYTREELLRKNDKDLLELYDTYTSNFDFEKFDITNPVFLKNLRQKSLMLHGKI